MKICRSIVVVFSFLSIFLVALAASAHNPNAIHVNYDTGRGQLNVIVQHPVNDKWKHFVNKVDVYKNGRKAWGQEFEFQTSFRNLTIPPIKLSAIDGDEFRVVAFCSEGGKYEQPLTVGVSEKEIAPGPIEHDVGK